MSAPPALVLVGPPGSGKSSLAACLPSAQRSQVVDPGDVAEERSALAHARGVLFVIGAPDGIDAPTAYVWREVAAAHLPRAIIVTKLDDPRADFDETCALIARLFDPHGCLALTLPVLDDDEGLAGFLDLITGDIADYSQSPTGRVPAEDAHLDLSATARERLADTLAASDLTFDDIAHAVATGLITPIVGFAAPGCIGRDEVVRVIDDLLVSSPPPTVIADWPAPLQSFVPSVALVLTFPVDYSDEVLAYARRLSDAVVTTREPGDGTITMRIEGAAESLVSVPIHVHGMTDGTSTCVIEQ